MDALATPLFECIRCRERKPSCEYNKDSSRSTGLQYWCRRCQKAHHKKNRIKYANHDKTKHRKDPRHRMLSGARKRAEQKGLDFNITLADICIPTPCPLLHIPIAVGERGFHAGSPTIDRKDPSKGYVPSNVWVVSWRANLLKNNATVEELETLLGSLKFLRKM
jgi:hypothetical protein